MLVRCSANWGIDKESSKALATCENDVITCTNEQAIEIEPQAFQVAQEKKIEADHVFVGDAVTNLN